MNDPGQFIGLTAGATRWQVLPEHHGALFGPDGLRLDDWRRDGRARVVKHGPHRTVYRVTLPGLDFHLKHYRLPDTRAWLRELVRPCKARMEYDRALAVAARGLPTITPLALGERRPGHGPGDSFLLTRTLADVEPWRSSWGGSWPACTTPASSTTTCTPTTSWSTSTATTGHGCT
jgi:hypothetical protein